MIFTQSKKKLYGIVDKEISSKKNISILNFASAFFEGGGEILQYRDKISSQKEIIHNIEGLLKLQEKYPNSQLVMNDYLKLALKYHTFLHLGQEDYQKITNKNNLLGIPFGLSTHTKEDILQVSNMEIPPSYIGFGSVFYSRTKQKPANTYPLENIIKMSLIPVVYIGGITLENLDVLPKNDLCYYAVIQDFFCYGNKTKDIKKYTEKFLAKLGTT